MKVELTPDQAALLKKLAESALRDIKAEVRRSETREYHDQLQREEAELANLITALGSGA
jgi:hypothetical protein